MTRWHSIVGVLLALLITATPAWGLETLAIILATIAATLGPVGTAVVVGALLAGIQYGIQAALAPKPQGVDLRSRVQNNRSILRDNAAPIRVGYGVNKTGGVLLFAETVSKDGEVLPHALYLHFAIAIAAGPITDIYDIELNDNEANTVLYSRRVLFMSMLGYDDQPMLKGPVWLDKLIQLPKTWLEKYRPLRGVAYTWTVLRFDPRVFPSGAPSVRVTWKGRKVYDPRFDVAVGGTQRRDDIRTWEYSTNPAICLADYLSDRFYGRKVPWADICQDCLIAAANACDEWVPAPSRATEAVPNPTRRRYTCNGNFAGDERPLDVIGRLLSAFAGSAQYYDGLWHLKAGVSTAVAADGVTGAPIMLTPDTLRDDGRLDIAPRPGLKERVNSVTGVYVNPAANYQPDTFPIVTDPAFVTADGNQEALEEIELSFTTDIDEARALATVLLKQSRLGLRCLWPGRPSLQQLVPWSVVWVVYPYGGWGFVGRVSVDSATKTYSATGVGTGVVVGQAICWQGFSNAANNGQKTVTAVTADSITVSQTCVTESTTAGDVFLGTKLFRILNRTQHETGAVDLSLAEYSDDIYVFTLNPVALPAPTALPNPFASEPPLNVAAVEYTHVNPDGSRVSALRVTWDAPTASGAEGYRVRWRALVSSSATATTLQERSVREPTRVVEITGLPVGTYEVQVSTLFGSIYSTPVTVLTAVTYLTTAPPSPIALRVRLTGAGTRVFTWSVGGDGIEPPDLEGYDLRFKLGVPTGTALAEWTAGRPLLDTLIRAREAETAAPVRPGEYTFTVRARDKSGRYSDDAAMVQATVLPIDASVVTAREFREEGWPGTITNGRIAASGAIEADGDLTWSDITTWASVTTWGDNTRRVLFYVSDVIDLGREMMVRATARVTARRARATRVWYAKRSSATDHFSPFRPDVTFRARYIQVQCVVQPLGGAGGTASLDGLSVTFTETLDQLIVDDYNMAARPSVDELRRVEDNVPEWHLGTIWKAGLQSRSAGGQSLTVDNDAFVQTGTSGAYISIPHAALLDLVAPSSIEFTGRINQATGTDRPVLSKSGAWEVLWTAGVGLFFKPAAGYTGVDPSPHKLSVRAYETFHAAFVREAGRWRGYLDGELVFDVPASFGLVSTANALQIGAQGAATVDLLIGELRIWAGGRSHDQLRQWMNAQLPPGTNQLAAYYRCNEASGTAVVDLVAGNNGTLTGSGYTRAWICARESPPIPLALMPRALYARVLWNGDATGAVITAVEASIDEGASWTTIPRNVLTIIPGIVVGSTPTARLRLRQFLLATSSTARPTVDSLAVVLSYPRAVGDLVLAPSAPFSEMRSASVTAIQNVAGPHMARLMVKDAAGARWVVEDVAGIPRDALVDVLFQGGRLV